MKRKYVIPTVVVVVLLILAGVISFRRSGTQTPEETTTAQLTPSQIWREKALAGQLTPNEIKTDLRAMYHTSLSVMVGDSGEEPTEAMYRCALDHTTKKAAGVREMAVWVYNQFSRKDGPKKLDPLPPVDKGTRETYALLRDTYDNFISTATGGSGEPTDQMRAQALNYAKRKIPHGEIGWCTEISIWLMNRYDKKKKRQDQQ